VSEQIIDSANILLKGFTVDELKDIVQHIRKVENHRASRFVFIKLDTPHMSEEECKQTIKNLWPDPHPPAVQVIRGKENAGSSTD